MSIQFTPDTLATRRAFNRLALVQELRKKGGGEDGDYEKFANH